MVVSTCPSHGYLSSSPHQGSIGPELSIPMQNRVFSQRGPMGTPQENAICSANVFSPPRCSHQLSQGGQSTPPYRTREFSAPMAGCAECKYAIHYTVCCHIRTPCNPWSRYGLSYQSVRFALEGQLGIHKWLRATLDSFQPGIALLGPLAAMVVHRIECSYIAALGADSCFGS